MRTRRASTSTHTDGKACVSPSRRISKNALRKSKGSLTSSPHVATTLTRGDYVQFSRAAQAW